MGEHGEVGPENQGRIGNGGFLIGPTGITVIDTGVSDAEGRDRLAAIRRISGKPIELVIITHAVQEFLFGNTAFEGAGTEFLCHRETADLMRARCAHCLENLVAILGEGVMAGTRLVIPGRTVDGTTDLSVGGRRLRLIHRGWASTPGDLMVLDLQSKVLFAGGVLVNGRVPLLRDGKLDAWVRAIDALGSLPVTRIVPGYGPPMAAAERAATRDYLLALDARVRRLYGDMASLMEAVDQSELPQFSGWDAYATINRRNAHQRYLELEVDELSR